MWVRCSSFAQLDRCVAARSAMGRSQLCSICVPPGTMASEIPTAEVCRARFNLPQTTWREAGRLSAGKRRKHDDCRKVSRFGSAVDVTGLRSAVCRLAPGFGGAAVMSCCVPMKQARTRSRRLARPFHIMTPVLHRSGGTHARSGDCAGYRAG
ncbi:hypothetical protein BC628DRAFT_580331 [Trametes gibbosa]|nr:hypothetical protein BC628DRAFT_580331 [Trametes gibbosa]